MGTALIRAAKLAGFTVTLLDTRGEEQIGEAIQAADRFIRLEHFGEAAEAKLPLNACYVVATYSHATDGEALGGVLRHTDAAYIGMIADARSKRFTAGWQRKDLSRSSLLPFMHPSDLPSAERCRRRSQSPFWRKY